MGATIAKAGADRATPLATATLVIAANAPDIDVFAYTHGEYFALSFRRGITHGIPALLVLPFLVAGFMLGWDRWVRRRRDPDAQPARPRAILLLSAIGLVTHPTLDWMNTYGMRWLLPFDGAWTYGDALFIVDPWLWLILGGAVFLSASQTRAARLRWGALGLITSALILLAPLPLSAGVRMLWAAGMAAIVTAGARSWPGSADGRRRLATGAGALATLYICGMVVGDLAARRAVLHAAETAGLEVEDLMVQPLPANPFMAEIEVRTGDSFVPGRYRAFGSPTVELFPDEAVPLLEAPPGLTATEVARIVADAGDVPDAHYWLEWSRYPYVRLTRHTDGWQVAFRDARYDGQEGTGGLSGVTVVVQP